MTKALRYKPRTTKLKNSSVENSDLETLASPHGRETIKACLARCEVEPEVEQRWCISLEDRAFI
jgi:hypothetical protein